MAWSFIQTQNIINFPFFLIHKLLDQNSNKYGANNKKQDNGETNDPNLNKFGTACTDLENMDKNDNQIDSNPTIDKKQEEKK